MGSSLLVYTLMENYVPKAGEGDESSPESSYPSPESSPPSSPGSSPSSSPRSLDRSVKDTSSHSESEIKDKPYLTTNEPKSAEKIVLAINQLNRLTGRHIAHDESKSPREEKSSLLQGLERNQENAIRDLMNAILYLHNMKELRIILYELLSMHETLSSQLNSCIAALIQLGVLRLELMNPDNQEMTRMISQGIIALADAATIPGISDTDVRLDDTLNLLLCYSDASEIPHALYNHDLVGYLKRNPFETLLKGAGLISFIFLFVSCPPLLLSILTTIGITATGRNVLSYLLIVVSAAEKNNERMALWDYHANKVAQAITTLMQSRATARPSDSKSLAILGVFSQSIHRGLAAKVVARIKENIPGLPQNFLQELENDLVRIYDTNFLAMNYLKDDLYKDNPEELIKALSALITIKENMKLYKKLFRLASDELSLAGLIDECNEINNIIIIRQKERLISRDHSVIIN